MPAQRFAAGVLLRLACSVGRLQKHDAGAAEACRLPFGGRPLKPCTSLAVLGEECPEKVDCPTLPAHARLHGSQDDCISPELLVPATACVAIDIRSHTFDFVNCRHSVSRNASVSAA